MLGTIDNFIKTRRGRAITIAISSKHESKQRIVLTLQKTKMLGTIDNVIKTRRGSPV